MLAIVFTAAFSALPGVLRCHCAVRGLWYFLCCVIASDQRIFRSYGCRDPLLPEISGAHAALAPVSFGGLAAPPGLMIVLVTQILIFGRIPAWQSHLWIT